MSAAADITEPSLDLDGEDGSFDSFFGKVAPPRTEDDELDVTELWHTKAFGLTVALWENGYVERETFRQQLIETIGEWDETHDTTDGDWDYWECWMEALVTLLEEHDLLEGSALEDEVNAILETC